MSWSEIVLRSYHRLLVEGGPGSGHFGHSGGEGGPDNPGGSTSDGVIGKQSKKYSSKGIDFFDKLPNREPSEEIKKVEKTYGVNAEWKVAPGNMTSQHIIGSKIIIMNPKRSDFGVELHEYGHLLLSQGYIDDGGVRRVFDFYKKSAKRYEADKKWMVIDKNIVWGKDHKEMWADFFKLYHLGKLSGDSLKVTEMILKQSKEKYGKEQGIL